MYKPNAWSVEEAIGTQQYDGDGVTPTISNGVVLRIRVEDSWVEITLLEVDLAERRTRRGPGAGR
jgi:hypothetical protein